MIRRAWQTRARGGARHGAERDGGIRDDAGMSLPRAVILDVDGTLIDSNRAHAEAWVEALREVGVEAPVERIRKLIGMGGDKLLPRAVGLDPEQGDGRRASRRRGEIFQSKYLPEVKPFPKARELLERLHAGGLRLTVASSAKPQELQAMLDRIGVRQLIETQTSGGNQPSKPDPDTVEGVLARIGLSAEQTLMLGDTPYDVEAAGRAGVQTVAVRCGGWDVPELSGAMAIYDDPADILAHFDESPFVRKLNRPEPPVTPREREHQSAMTGKAVSEAEQSR